MDEEPRSKKSKKSEENFGGNRDEEETGRMETTYEERG